jgi:hypothetical protein
VRVADDGHQTIVCYVRRTAPTATCPGCGVPSDHVQSRSYRTVSDVAVRGWRVRVEIDVRRFACRNPACDDTIFCERLLPWVPAYGRRSAALTAWLTAAQDHDLTAIGQRATAAFLVVPFEDASRYMAAGLYIAQLFRTLTEIARDDGGRLPIRVNFLLDEFGVRLEVAA